MIEQQQMSFPFIPMDMKCQQTTSSETTTSMLAALCGGCCGPICDRYIMRVTDTYYHEGCLQCTSCSMRLMHSCFQRNGKLYCRIDYERLFIKNRCLGCGDRINSEELVMRTSDNVFHLKCFSCVVCGIQLQKGEQYVVKQSQLFCRTDYEKEVEMLQGFNDDYFSEDVFPSKIDGRRGPKRPRTILNTQQRRAFKASFDVSPKPCRKVRENLAKETGLSLRIVQVWFQNQRAKVKKIQKKARQENKSCSETESLGESSMEHDGSTKIKDENESDTESYVNGNLEADQKMVVKEEMENEEECFKKALNLCTSLQNYKEVDTIKCEKNYEICEGCGQKIHDRYLMRVADTSWHEQRLSCCLCGVPLNHSCYVRNTKLYCKTDYDRIFGVKCTRCGDRVQPNDMVMRAQNYIFHLPCFVCWICCQPLQKGEQFILRGGQLFCRHDFEKDLYLSQHCHDDDLLLDETISRRDGRRGPKRPRTILTSAQRRQFKASFELSPKPCRKVREALAKDTGLSVRVVQVWFQNQRAKMKKIQRKAKQDGDKHSDKDSCKDDKGIKQESPNSEHGHYLGMDGSFSSQPLNPNMPYSPDDYPANSNDSFCSSDISLDGSNFDQLDEATSDTLSLQNVELQSHGHNNSHESGIGSLSSGINPIDKLYLMQNSYFNSDH